MISRNFLLSCAGFLAVLSVNAQTVQPCIFGSSFEGQVLSDSVLMNQIRARSQYIHSYNSSAQTVQSSNVLMIPVVVHIMHNSGEAVGQGLNISYAQVLSQIARMNADFANDTIYTQLSSGDFAENVGIQFCLARVPIGPTQWTDSLEPGVMRHVAPTNVLDHISYLDTAVYANQLLSITHPNTNYFPFDRFLNIWTVNQITDLSGSFHAAGYSPHPIGQHPNYPLDGIVMDVHMFGDNTVNNNNFPIIDPNYNTGNICAHEAGHYLNLWHTFTGGCSGTLSTDCTTGGDFICDTPPDTNQTSSCAITNSCGELYFALPDQDHDDMIENYMTWHDDNCINTFTYEQGVVMRNYLQLFRGTLIDPVNLSLTGVASPNGCLPAQLLAPIIAPVQICVNDTVSFGTYTGIGFLAVSWQWQFMNAIPATSTQQNPNVSWTTPGQHLVILSAFDASNNIVTDSIYIYVNPCAALASDQGHWYFGWKAGIDFSSGVATHDNAAYLNASIISSEGTAVVSDTAGALIFYTNGKDLWDKNHILAVTGILGDTNTSKTQIVSVPHPLHSNWWYIFTGVEYSMPGPIYYSIVADSNGTIIPVILNDTLPRLPGCPTINEPITAIPHCNGRDYWVVTRARGPAPWSSTLLVYLVSPAGITDPSGSSNFPGTYVLPSGATADAGGNSIKASPDNAHIVVTHIGTMGISVLDFNNATGAISNERTIPVGPYQYYYGTSFSPDSRFVYYAHQTAPQIFRIDLTQPTLTPTIEGTMASGEIPAQMQLGPDSALYIATYYDPYVANFSNPSSILSPGFNQQAVNLATDYGQIKNILGLPNMIDGIVPPEAPLTFHITFQNCSTIAFAPTGCWGTAYNYAWNFGDSTPIDTNTAGTHTYAASGQYTISLTLSVGSYSFPVIQQQINIMLIAPLISGPVSVCSNQFGFSTYSVAQNLQSYQWSVTGGGIILNSDTLANCDIVWNSSGAITCVVNNGANCTFTVSVNVTVHQSPVADAGPDTLFACPGGFFQVGGNPTASGGTAPYSYQWFPSVLLVNPSIPNPVAIVNGPTTYTVNVTDNNGCVSADIIFVDVDSSLSGPAITFASIPQTCDNGSQIDLALYTSPLNGTFSGSAVSGNFFDPAIALIPDSNTIYYLYTDSTTGCTSYDSNYVYVYNCCTPVTGVNTFNGDASSNYGNQFNATPVPVRINGTFYVNNTFYINNYNGPNIVRCASNASIVIKSGGRLVIQANSVLRACDDMWNGIIIEPGGELEVLTGSVIADAKQAIVSQNGAKFTLDRAELRDNYQNVIVEPFTGQGLHSGTIIRSRILGSNSLSLSPYAGVKTYSGMEITNVDSIYVGFPTVITDENFFRDMDFGIISTFSNVYIRNNQFRSIVSNSIFAVPSCCLNNTCTNPSVCNPPPYGTAIWATGGNAEIGGATIAYQNRFSTCTKGILAENGINATISHNDFQNITASSFIVQTYCINVRFCKTNTEIITYNNIRSSKNGILFGFSTLTVAVIDTNTINNIGGTGIQVTQTTQCPVSIGANSINATASSTGKYGIRVANAVVTNNIQYVEIHGNVTKKVEKHIWVTNFPFIAIDNANNMSFQNGVPATAQFGIQVQNSHNAYVDGNTVTKTGSIPTDTNYRKRLYGISMETNCYNTQVSNNGLFRLGTGIQYFNQNNFPSTISCNHLFNDMRGILFKNTYVGDQGSPITFQNPNGIAQDNQWTIANSQSALYKSIWADNSPSNTWYYRSATSNYYPIGSQQQPAFYFTLSGPLPNAPSFCTLPCPTCHTQANLAKIASRNAPYDTLSYSPMFMSDQTAYAQLRADLSLLSLGTQYDSTLTRFYSQNQPDNIGLIDEAYVKATQEDTTGARLAKDGIIPRGNPDLNHKLVLDIYLRTWARRILYFTPQDSAILYAIATQNVMSGGTAVYDARVMLDIDVDDIGYGAAARIAGTNSDSLSVGQLYPNPTLGTSTYEIELQENESGYIIVTDIFGRPVSQLPLQEGYNVIEIDLAELPSGIYLYRTVINEETKQTGKIILDR